MNAILVRSNIANTPRPTCRDNPININVRLFKYFSPLGKKAKLIKRVSVDQGQDESLGRVHVWRERGLTCPSAVALKA